MLKVVEIVAIVGVTDSGVHFGSCQVFHQLDSSSTVSSNLAGSLGLHLPFPLTGFCHCRLVNSRSMTNEVSNSLLGRDLLCPSTVYETDLVFLLIRCSPALEL